MALCKQGYYRIILGRETKPHHLAERSKFLNHLDEAFGYLCAHISRYLLFHLEGLRTPKEAWEKLEVLFGKKYELWGHILENELISLHPNSFETSFHSMQKFSSDCSIINFVHSLPVIAPGKGVEFDFSVSNDVAIV